MDTLLAHLAKFSLHDAAIKSILVDPIRASVTIEIDDLWSNYLDLPEYRGPTPATLIFGKVSNVEVEGDLSVSSGFNIYDAEVTDCGESCAVEIGLCPGGVIKLVCAEFECAEFSALQINEI